jgi:hypothetical protein
MREANGCQLMRVLDFKDIVPLLRAEVQRAGGVSAWSRKTGVHRTIVSKVLNNLKPPTKSIIKALKLRAAFIVSKDWPKRPRRSRQRRFSGLPAYIRSGYARTAGQ